MKKRYKNVLFLCNTYMQLITAIQIKQKMLENVNADIILSDHSQNAEKVEKNLGNTKLFRRVRLIKTKYIMFEQNVFEDVKDTIALILGRNKKYKDSLWSEMGTYDAIFYYNVDFYTYFAYDSSVENGLEPKCIRYEEGIASYPAMKEIQEGNRLKIYRKFRKMQGKKDVFDETKDFFCFYPDLFPTASEENCHKIPFIERKDKKTIALLNIVFGYAPICCNKRYIFFTTSADIDGKNIREDEIVNQVAEVIGKENMIIKVHPRDSRKIYRNMGFEIWENSEIPWEIIQVNNDFSEKVFISLSSGSILNFSAMLNEDNKAYYLFPCVKGRNNQFDDYCEELKKILKKLQTLGYCQNHKAISELKEII